MPQCPCSSIFLFFDRQFGPLTFDFSSATFAVPVAPSERYAPNGKVRVMVNKTKDSAYSFDDNFN